MQDKKAIRLLYVTRETFPTYRVDIDVLFGKEMSRRGHMIDFVMQAKSDKTPAGETAWYGRSVWVGRTAAGGGRLGRALKVLRGVWHDVDCMLRLTRSDRYAAIQVRDKFVVGALGLIIARWRGLSFFYWLSFPVPESQISQARAGAARFPVINWMRGRIFGWLLYRVILPGCDHAFVQSERMKEDVVSLGADPANLTPVPMGIDLDEFLHVPVVERHLADRALLIGYLGTLGAQRHLEVLLEALVILLQQGIDARIVFVGGSDRPEDVEQLQIRACELGIADRLEISGQLPRHEALARIRDVDIAVSPFYPIDVLLSASPTKLVEYMALGLPVVANTHPEQRLVLRESGAGVCVPWGARHFARGIAWLSRRSPKERSEIGMRGRDWVTKHRGYGAIASSLEARYLKEISRKERGN